MAQKIRPDSLRLGILYDWKSRWLFTRKKKFFLQEDFLIRKEIEKRLRNAGISSIEIERKGEDIKILIKVQRVGLVIGRGGKNLEDLKKEIKRMVDKFRRENGAKDKAVINISIEELDRQEISAPVVASQIALSLEKRLPFRRVIKKQLETILLKPGIEGAKIKVCGRLNGAAIARCEQVAKGKLPLSTFRANIDYGEAIAYTIYGTIGIKVWIYKGEIFK